MFFFYQFRLDLLPLEASRDVIAVIDVLVTASAKSTLENSIGLNLNSFGTFIYFVSDDPAAVANVLLRHLL